MDDGVETSASTITSDITDKIDNQGEMNNQGEMDNQGEMITRVKSRKTKLRTHPRL